MFIIILLKIGSNNDATQHNNTDDIMVMTNNKNTFSKVSLLLFHSFPKEGGRDSYKK